MTLMGQYDITTIPMIVCLCLAYFVLSFVLAWFFEDRLPEFGLASARSVLITALVAVAAFSFGTFLRDVELGNRIQHALGGGFLAYMLCVFAVRDSNIRVNYLKFIIFSGLVATSLGVLNELFEYVVQANTHLIFADSLWDTWRDLASNTVGLIVGVVLLTPLLPGRARRLN